MGGSSERLQLIESPFRELVDVLSWIHDGRLFIVSDTYYVGNFQTTILSMFIFGIAAICII